MGTWSIVVTMGLGAGASCADAGAANSSAAATAVRVSLRMAGDYFSFSSGEASLRMRRALDRRAGRHRLGRAAARGDRGRLAVAAVVAQARVPGLRDRQRQAQSAAAAGLLGLG